MPFKLGVEVDFDVELFIKALGSSYQSYIKSKYSHTT